MNKIKIILFILTFYLFFLLVKILTILFKFIQIKQWFPKKKNSILYLENFPVENAGYQHRTEKWVGILTQNGFKAKVKTTVKSKLKFENCINKHFKIYLIKSMIIRLYQILISIRYKTIIVRRELLLYNDYGNLFMEKLLFSFHNKKNIILDFDDDIDASKNIEREISFFGKLLQEQPDKFSKTLKLYSNFIVCSSYLKEKIFKLNHKANVNIIPTCVDISTVQKKYNPNLPEIINIVWVGSNGNQKYLDDIVYDLNKVHEEYKIKLIVISGENYINRKANFTIENIKWQLSTQNKYIEKAHIGIMPLRKTDEDKGKCGFKLLQYMSLGLVSVANGITINFDIVEDKKNAFLVKESWYETLLDIIKMKKHWAEIGQKARETIIDKYSFSLQTNNYITFVNRCAE